MPGLAGGFSVGAEAARIVLEPNIKKNIPAWADKRLGVFLWSKQHEICRTLIENQRVMVPSCHDSGKSFLAAVISSWWIDTHPPKEAIIVTTAPSAPQIKGVLWKEINLAWEKANKLGNPLPGKVNQTEWWIGNYQAGIGRKPNDYRPELFAGFHARYPLVLLDEADGLPNEMWEGIEALMTSKEAKLLAIGNPLDPNSRFAEEINSGVWPVIRISAEDTPNFTGEPVPPLLNDVLLSKEWVEGRRKKWGEDHPFWYGRVLAQHPPENINSIIRASDVVKCQAGIEEKDGDPVPPPAHAFVQLGIDVAGSEAGDKTVVSERRGNYAMRAWELQSGDDDAIEEFIVDCATKTQPNAIAMDVTGLGFGFTGRIRRRLPRVQVLPVNFGAKATVKQEDGSKKFANMRAQLWWEIGRELSKKGPEDGWNLSYMSVESEEVGIDDTIVELTAPRYREDVLSEKKIIQVEEKSQVKKRIGRSPDHADSRLLSFLRPQDAVTEEVPAKVSRPAKPGMPRTPSAASTPRTRVARGSLTGTVRPRGVRGKSQWQ